MALGVLGLHTQWRNWSANVWGCLVRIWEKMLKSCVLHPWWIYSTTHEWTIYGVLIHMPHTEDCPLSLVAICQGTKEYFLRREKPTSTSKYKHEYKGEMDEWYSRLHIVKESKIQVCAGLPSGDTGASTGPSFFAKQCNGCLLQCCFHDTGVYCGVLWGIGCGLCTIS